MSQRWLLVFILLMAAPVPAQECVDYHDIPRLWSGPFPLGETPSLFEAADSCLVWAVDSTLVWCPVDEDGPQVGQQVRQVVPGGIASLRLDGSRAAVATRSGGWQVIEFASAVAPRVLGAIPGGHGCRDVDVLGNWVYAAVDSDLVVCELVPDEAPREAARVQWHCTPGCRSYDFWQVNADSGICWTVMDQACETSDYQDLVAFDITKPDTPREMASFGFWHNDGNGSMATGRLQASGHQAAFSYRFENLSGFVSGGFEVYTVRQDTISAVLRFGDLRHIGVDLAGHELYATVGAASMDATRRYVLEDDTWRLADVFAGGGAWPAITADGLWLVRGAAVARLRGPRFPAWPQMQIAYESYRMPHEIVPLEGRLLVSQDWSTGGEWPIYASNVAVLDASDPLRLHLLGEIAAESWSTLPHPVVSGDLVYTTRGIWNWRTLSLTGAWTQPNLALVGGVLWCKGTTGVDLYDLQVPAAPVLVGSLETSAPVLSAAVGGDLAVLVAQGMLIVVDVTDPLEPRTLSEYLLNTWRVSDVAIDGGHILVSGADGLIVYDLDASGSLVVVGALTGRELGRIAVDGRVVYATSTAGVAVIDLTDPAAPSVLGEFAAARSGIDVALAPDLVYLNDGRLRALVRQCEPSLATLLQDFAVTWRGPWPCVSWSLPEPVAEVRVLASAGQQAWSVPWHAEGDRYVAVDERAPGGRTVAYELQVRLGGAWTTLARESVTVPDLPTVLEEPRPNPFNAGTVLRFTLGRPDEIRLEIHDLRGRLVRTLLTGPCTAGPHEVAWDGKDDHGRAVAAGAYAARLRTSHGDRQAKLMLLK